MGEEGVSSSCYEYEVSFWGDENVLELDSGDGYISLWILKTNTLYTLKKLNFMLCEIVGSEPGQVT